DRRKRERRGGAGEERDEPPSKAPGQDDRLGDASECHVSFGGLSGSVAAVADSDAEADAVGVGAGRGAAVRPARAALPADLRLRWILTRLTRRGSASSTSTSNGPGPGTSSPRTGSRPMRVVR